MVRNQVVGKSGVEEGNTKFQEIPIEMGEMGIAKILLDLNVGSVTTSLKTKESSIHKVMIQY